MPSPGATEPDDDSTYLAPDQLDRRAQAVAAIDLPYPDLAPPGHFRAALTLFIEHDGRVSRVRLEPDPHAPGGGALPPVLEDSARQAFLASLFEPGTLGGRAGRSRLPPRQWRTCRSPTSQPVSPIAARAGITCRLRSCPASRRMSMSKHLIAALRPRHGP